MYIKMAKYAVIVWGSLLAPFSAGIWLAVALSIAMIPTFLSIAEKIWRRYGFKEEPPTTFIQTLLYSFGAFCFQGKV
jgi:hypothetical protein